MLMLDSYRDSWLPTIMATAAAANLRTGTAPANRIVPLNTKRFVRGRPHQGRQEMARRRQQIASGILRIENGLAIAQPI